MGSSTLPSGQSDSFKLSPLLCFPPPYSISFSYLISYLNISPKTTTSNFFSAHFYLTFTLIMTIHTLILIVSLLVLVSAKSIRHNHTLNADIVCPDATSICPSTSTCCISTDGDYSCCPIQSGVCCADHIHCCPEHYKCDLKIFKCDRTFAAQLIGVRRSVKKQWPVTKAKAGPNIANKHEADQGCDEWFSEIASRDERAWRKEKPFDSGEMNCGRKGNRQIAPTESDKIFRLLSVSFAWHFEKCDETWREVCQIRTPRTHPSFSHGEYRRSWFIEQDSWVDVEVSIVTVEVQNHRSYLSWRKSLQRDPWPPSRHHPLCLGDSWWSPERSLCQAIEWRHTWNSRCCHCCDPVRLNSEPDSKQWNCSCNSTGSYRWNHDPQKCNCQSRKQWHRLFHSNNSHWEHHIGWMRGFLSSIDWSKLTSLNGPRRYFRFGESSLYSPDEPVVTGAGVTVVASGATALFRRKLILLGPVPIIENGPVVFGLYVVDTRMKEPVDIKLIIELPKQVGRGIRWIEIVRVDRRVGVKIAVALESEITSRGHTDSNRVVVVVSLGTGATASKCRTVSC